VFIRHDIDYEDGIIFSNQMRNFFLLY